MKKYISFSITIMLFGLFNLFLHNDSFATMGGPCVCSSNDTYGSLDIAMCTAPAVVVGGACYNGDNTGIGLDATGGCLDGDCSDQEFLSFVATNDTILYTIDTTSGDPLNMTAGPDVLLMTYDTDCPATANTTCPGGGGTPCINECNSGFGNFTFTGLTVGWTYYLIVESNDVKPCSGCGTCPPTSGTYTLCMSEPHCGNGVQDADETGIDCGGVDCIACHCINGFTDFDEDSVDCGGVDCIACANCTFNEECGTPNVLPLSGGCLIGACNTGASSESYSLMGSPCVDPDGPMVWYEVTTATIDYYLDVDITNATFDPHIQVWADCNTFYTNGCDEGSGGSASVSQLGVGGNETVFVSVSPQDGTSEGTFDICITSYPDPSACAVDDTLIANPPPDITDIPIGSYPPNTTVEFCYTLTTYEQAACNYLHGIVPIIGSGWLPFDYTTDVTVSPATAGGKYMGSPVGVWSWFADGVVLNNASGAPVGAGWFFLTDYCEPNCPGGPGGDPNDSYGDSNFPNCDADQGPWTVCFELTTSDTCNSGADLSVGIKTYADGETGAWPSLACAVDPVKLPALPSPTMFCPDCGIDTIIITNVLCFGDSNGSAAVTMDTTGIPPYSYLWSNGDTNATATGLPAGTYTVSTTDSSGCIVSATITITQPSLLVAGISDSTIVACFGDSTGTATVTPTGGTTPFTYSWNDPGAQTDSTATGLPSGTYTVVVTDSNSCIDSTSVTITDIPILTLSFLSTNVNCFGACNGTATAFPSGGTFPYDYSWDDGASQTTQTATGLCAGPYSVTVTDDSNCVVSCTPVLAKAFEITSILVDACTAGLEGKQEMFSFRVGANDLDTADLFLIWPNNSWKGVCTDPVFIANANSTITGGGYLLEPPGGILPAGAKVILVTNTAFDTSYASFQDLTDTIYIIFQCADNSNGHFANYSSGGGTRTLSVCFAGNCDTVSYERDLLIKQNGTPGAENGAIVNFDRAGNATYINDGCIAPFKSFSSAVLCITITEPDPIYLSTTTDSTTCAGVCDGTATVVVDSGGTPGFTYSWSPGAQTTAAATGLCDDIYTVTVTDTNGCTATATDTVSDGPLADASFSSSPNQCFITNSFTFTNTGTPPGPGVSYTWNFGDLSTSLLENPPPLSYALANTYNVIHTVTNGVCTDVDSMYITVYPQPSANITGSNVTCNDACDGIADLTVSGGTSPFTYLWDPGVATGEDTTGLCPGTYKVTVSDIYGCQDSDTVIITEPDSLLLLISGTDLFCNGVCDGAADLIVTGGTTPYSYSWSNGDTTQNVTLLCADTFRVVVTDSNSCQDSISVIITEPTLLSLSISGTDLICNSVCDGAADLTVTGGTAPYAYSWSNGDTTQNVTSLCADTFRVVVADSNSCQDSIDVIITEPSLLTVDATSTDLLCNEICDGTASTVVSGGTTPYAYQWNDTTNQTSAIADSLCAGAYQIMVTDTNGCQDSATVIISEPPVLTTSIIGDSASCNGVCDGSANLTVGGGTSPYTYLWSNLDTTQDISGLCSGLNTVDVTDSNGCIMPDSIFINEPSLLTASIVDTNVSCNGVCDGSADVTVLGGTPPYTHSWSNGESIEDITNLCDGTYADTIRDANGCTVIESIPISEPDVLTTFISGTNTSCFDTCDGAADLIVAGGTTPYSYNWSNGDTIQDIFDLCADTFYVTVTDTNGCTRSDTIIITEPAALSASALITNVSCNGLCDGEADLTVSGGTSPYSHSWSNGDGTEDITSLCATLYTDTIRDVNGCTILDTINITQPDSLIADITGTNVSCKDSCDGTAILTVSGGTTPYGYQWSTLETIKDIVGLCADTFTVLVTDTNNCTVSDTVIITEPTQLTADVIGTNISCNTACDGSANLTVTGGTLPYSYAWSNADTLEDTDTLCPATYSVIVTDSNGCTAADSTEITEPSAILLTVSIITDVSCNGACDGQANASVSGGTTPFTFLWDDSLGQPTPVADSLCADTFQVLVTDANLCKDSASVIISEPPVLTASTSGDSTSCNGLCDGQAVVTPSGGTSPYFYQWDDLSFQITDTATGLCAGTFNVIVTDSNDCTFNTSYVVNQPSAMTLTPDTVDAACGIASGEASVSVSGGTSPYTYLWSPGSLTTDTITGLFAGAYTVVVTDSNNCQDSITINVNDAGAPVADIFDSSYVSCNGDSDGSAAATGSGGLRPFDWSWSPPAVSIDSFATGLQAGVYTVTITDALLCVSTATITITEPGLLIPFITSSTDVACNGDSSGSATVSVSGGTPGYTYSWVPYGDSGTIALNLISDTFTVIVTDTNGCDTSVSVIISEPPALSTTITDTSVSCYGACDGAAYLEVFGGQQPYISYDWSNTATSEDVSDLCAGTFYVTVTDFNSCTISDSVVITEPDSLTAGITGTNVSCKDSCDGTIVLTVSGGTLPYSYAWSSGDTTQNLSDLCAATYDITVTDSNGCIVSESMIITEPDALASGITPTNVSCFDTCDGIANLTVIGGTTPYSYSWSNGDSIEDISSLCADTFYVLITDTNGCTGSDTVIITEPAALSVSDTFTNVSCYGICDGEADLTVTGGTSPYSHSWSSGVTTNPIIGLCANTYTDTIRDANGCTILDTIDITEPDSLITGIAGTNVSCADSCDGTAILTVSGGTTPYEYLWSPTLQIIKDIADLCADTFTVVVTDTNNCTVSDTVIITEPLPLTDSISGTDLACNGICAGEVDLTVSGGTLPYSYLWSGGDTTEDRDSLCAAIYDVTIIDSNGCILLSNITITQPDTLVSIISGTNLSCNDSCDGAANLSVIGGKIPYAFSWTNGDSTEDLTNICADTFVVTITDSNNCILTDSIIITEPLILIVTDSATNVSCNGGSTGAIDLTVTGGTPIYNFVWCHGPTIKDVTNLTAGDYCVTVTDGNGCRATDSITISEPDSIVLTTTTIDANCGQADGQASVIATGGTTPYNYSWNTTPFPQINDTAFNLTNGSYTVTVTDTNVCTKTATISINDIGGGTASITLNNNVSCNGSCNGSATVSMTGGTPGFIYDWSSGDVDSTATALCADTNTVIVTDALNCIVTAQIIITSPDAINVIASNSDPLCYGDNSGVAIATVTGGTPGYSYTWTQISSGNTVSTDSIAINLVSGVYTIVVTDANSCVEAGAAILFDPNTLTATIVTTDASCNGICDGSATVTSFGGITGIHNYLWSDGQTSSTATGLCADTFFVTVTDANGCTWDTSVIVNEPAAISLSTGSINAICDSSNGLAFVTIDSGGVAPFLYQWNDDSTQTTDTAAGLPAGTYTVTVTDTTGCNNFATITVIDSGSPIATISSSGNVVCNGNCDGFAAVTVTPGTGTSPYDYLWDDPGTTTSDATGNILCPGFYSVTVTDVNGCKAIDTVTINEPDSVIISFSTIDETCYNACNGQATVNVTGGTPPNSYLWTNDPLFQTTLTADSLCPGTYTVKITDNNGCLTFVDTTIAQAPSFTVTASAISAICDSNTGSASATIFGGLMPPSSIAWINVIGGVTVSNTLNATGLFAGEYIIIVTDASGCVASDTAEVNDEPVPDPYIVSFTNITCNGGSDGMAEVKVDSGGAEPFSYLWDNGDTTTTADSLTAVAHSVTITDSNGCKAFANITLSEPAAINSSIQASTPRTCPEGLCNGSITVGASGGNGQYTYEWNDSSSQTTSIADSLCGGTYTVIVSDTNSCPADTSTWTLIDPDTIVIIDSIIQNVNCNGNSDGFIVVSVSGGTPVYTYNWPATGDAAALTTNLSIGTYTVIVTDQKGCVKPGTFSITQPQILVLSFDTSLADTCGRSSGMAIVNTIGGTMPYGFLWNPGVQTDSIATNLATGTYLVIITDTNLCKDSIDVFVDNVSGPEIDALFILQQIICNGDSNGVVTVTVKDGAPPYTYSWSPTGGNSDTAFGLFAQPYAITIFDVNNCMISDTILVPEPSPLVIDSIISSDESCTNACNGTATISISGGIPTYAYYWNGTKDSAAIMGLCSGTYYVTILDNIGCETNSSISIASSNFSSNDIITDVKCKGQCDGSVFISPSGGSGPYLYLIDSDTTVSLGATTIMGLCPGTYNYSITDTILGCFYQDSITITEPDSLLSTTGSTPEICTNSSGTASITLTGGTQPYSYSWTSGDTTQTATGLPAGIDSVTVTDANGCTTLDIVTIIRVYNMLETTTGSTPEICTNSSGTASITQITGGTPPYSYNWTSGDTTLTVTGLTTGIDTVTITDANGCTTLEMVTIIRIYDTLITTPVGIAVSCEDNDGIAIIRVSGGTAPYYYSWDGGQMDTITKLTNLAIGTYYVYITDNNNCFVNDSIKIDTTNYKCECNPNPYNGFSPNGDGVNDLWIIDSIEFCIEIDITVFNRWGDIVWKNKDGIYDNKKLEVMHVWDGTYYKNGLPVPDGTYFYVIEIPDKTVKPGWIYIVR